jgi:hypothetical protein
MADDWQVVQRPPRNNKPNNAEPPRTSNTSSHARTSHTAIDPKKKKFYPKKTSFRNEDPVKAAFDRLPSRGRSNNNPRGYSNHHGSTNTALKLWNPDREWKNKKYCFYSGVEKLFEQDKEFNRDYLESLFLCWQQSHEEWRQKHSVPMSAIIEETPKRIHDIFYSHVEFLLLASMAVPERMSALLKEYEACFLESTTAEAIAESVSKFVLANDSSQPKIIECESPSGDQRWLLDIYTYSVLRYLGPIECGCGRDLEDYRFSTLAPFFNYPVQGLPYLTESNLIDSKNTDANASEKLKVRQFQMNISSELCQLY